MVNAVTMRNKTFYPKNIWPEQHISAFSTLRHLEVRIIELSLSGIDTLYNLDVLIINYTNWNPPKLSILDNQKIWLTTARQDMITKIMFGSNMFDELPRTASGLGSMST